MLALWCSFSPLLSSPPAANSWNKSGICAHSAALASKAFFFSFTLLLLSQLRLSSFFLLFPKRTARGLDTGKSPHCYYKWHQPWRCSEDNLFNICIGYIMSKGMGKKKKHSPLYTGPLVKFPNFPIAVRACTWQTQKSQQSPCPSVPCIHLLIGYGTKDTRRWRSASRAFQWGDLQQTKEARMSLKAAECSISMTTGRKNRMQCQSTDSAAKQ